MDVYVGMITLVGASVCLVEHKNDKIILISVKYPRVRNYAIFFDGDID
jgi:hypothetical protein